MVSMESMVGDSGQGGELLAMLESRGLPETKLGLKVRRILAWGGAPCFE